MATLKATKLKVTNAPIKKLSQLDEIYKIQNATVITQNSTTYTIKYNAKGKIRKTSYKGKFNFSNQYKVLQSKFYSYKYYINNKINETLTGVSYTVGEVLQAASSVKNINKFMSKLFKKKDTIIGSKANDNLWGYAGNDKISGGSGNDFLVGGKGNDKLVGGKGKDIFKLSTGYGYDLIQDFKDKEDKIFIGSIKKLKLKNQGKDVYIYQGKDLLAKVKGAKGELSKKGKYLV